MFVCCLQRNFVLKPKCHFVFWLLNSIETVTMESFQTQWETVTDISLCKGKCKHDEDHVHQKKIDTKLGNKVQI